MMQQPQQQQQQYSASQSQPTTTIAEEEEEEVGCRTLWIGDLQPWMDEAYIDQCFVVYTGEIFPSKVRVIHNKKTGKSKCYGFIEFNSHAIAERALHQFNGKPMPSVVGSNFELNWSPSVVGGSNFKLNWASSSFELGLGLGLGLGGEKKKKKKRREVDFTISNRYDCIANSDVTDYMLQQQQQQQQPTLNINGARKRCGADCCLDRKHLLGIPDTNKNKTEVVDPRFPKDMAKPGSNANWVYMLKWFFSLSDGTLRPAFNLRSKKKWYMETMQSETDYVPNVAERVNIIGRYFTFGEDGGLDDLNVTSADLEDMLDELQRYVKSIDVANELYSSGCLVPLLNYLYDIHAGVRAKVAELVTTMVKNNPSGQQLVIEVNGLPPLLYNFTSDPDATSRTKALGAISSLIRNNKPGITAFRLANGYAALKDASSSKSVRIQREALNLIQYLLHENSSDCNIVTELGFPRIMMHLTSSDDAEVREAALGGLLVLASAAREERQLVDSLWNACLYLCCWVRMNLRLMLSASYLNHH